MEPEPARSIGAALREARERRELSFAECVSRTRIRRRYLEALENEDFAALPEPAYARGFLRTYAAALGVDSQRLIEVFDETVGTDEDRELAHVELRARDAPQSAPRTPRNRPGRGRAYLWALVGLITVIAVAYLASRGIATVPGPLDAELGSYFSR